MNLHYLPLAKPDESPTSLIRRAAIHNGYPSCAVFVNHLLGRTYYRYLLFKEGELACRLADLASPYEQELLKCFYQIDLDCKDQSRTIRLPDVRIPNALLRYAEAAICTDCWLEDLETRLKDLRSSMYCPRHNKQYLSCCLYCNRHFTWYNQITMKCSCGAPIQSPTASSADVYPESLVVGLLKSKDQARIDLFTQTLFTMDFYATKHRQNFARNRNIVKAAIGLVCNELDLCVESLATLSNAGSELGNAMLLAKLPTHSELIDIESISAALTYKAQTGNHTYAETLTTKQVKKLLNVSTVQWSRIQAHPQFPRSSRTRPGYHDQEINNIIAINEEVSIAKPHPSEHDLISFRACFTKLNMPKSDFSNLCKQGFFGSPHQFGKSSQCFFDAEKFSKFHHDYISVWQLSKEYGLAVRSTRRIISEQGLTSIKTDRYVTSTFPAPSFIKRTDIAIFKDHKKFTQENNDLSMKSLLATCPALPENMSSMVLSSHDAALRLGTYRQFIYALIHYRMLDGFAKGRRLYVTFDSFAKLKQEYMTGSELSQLLDVHSSCIPQILAHHGMTDSAIALPYKELQYLYRRADFSTERLMSLNPANCDYGRACRRKRLVKVSKICLEIGMFPHEIHKITDDIFNARPEHYRTATHRLSLSELEANRIRRAVSNLLPLSTLSSTHNIPLAEIEYRFTRNNAIPSFIMRNEYFISRTNYKVLDKFYASHFNLKHAQTITGLPNHYLQGLLNRKVIKGCHIPLGGCSMPPMLSRNTLRTAISRYKRYGSKLLHLDLIDI